MTGPKAGLDHDEILRYSRHLTLPEVGVPGQERLKSASVLLVGAGGLGSPAGLYLAAAGVGRIGLVDFDSVDVSNLQRQILYGTRDIGRPKLRAAEDRLRDLNPRVTLETHDTRLTSENALSILEPYDVIVDGTDNFPTRYLVNDASVLLGKPDVYGSIFRFEGQASVFWAKHGPCYRCLYPEPPPPGVVPSCAEGGVLGILPGTVGAIQATEAVKLILEGGKSLVGRLLLFNALEMRFRELTLRKDPTCPVCGDRPTIRELIDYDEFCGVTPAPVLDPATEEIGPSELSERVADENGPTVIDVRSRGEWGICRIENARLIPLADLSSRIGELDAQDDIVFLCRTGIRSARAVVLLREAGFRRVRSLRGGLMAWAKEVDPSMPRY